MARMTPESRVKFEVQLALSARNTYRVNYIGHAMGNSGTPDVLACFRGVFIGIECKAGTNMPTALQIQSLHNIWHAGGVALVITDKNVELVQQVLDLIAIRQGAVDCSDLSNYMYFVTPAVKEALGWT
jgi:hypothetical protein